MLPVFRLKPVGEGRCVSKYIGNIDASEQLVDQQMEMACDGLDTSKVVNEYLYAVGQYGSYEITARACVCNISGSYLIKNNKLPVYYCTILYEKRFVSGQLFTLFIYFDFDSQTEKELLTPKNYVNKLMSGKFTIELVSDESFLTFLLEKKKPEIEEQLMRVYMDEFNCTDDDSANMDLMKKIEDETTEKLNAYRKLFEPVEIAYPKKSLIISKMNELFKNDLFDDLINKGLEQREIDRREKSCPDQDYKIPKKVINLKEIKEHPEKLDEIMNNLSDVDSDDE
jgi:hypothetical protein